MAFTLGDMFFGVVEAGLGPGVLHSDSNGNVIEFFDITPSNIFRVEYCTVGLDGNLYVPYNIVSLGQWSYYIGKLEPDGAWTPAWASSPQNPSSHRGSAFLLTTQDGSIAAHTANGDTSTPTEFELYDINGTLIASSNHLEAVDYPMAHVPEEPDQAYIEEYPNYPVDFSRTVHKMSLLDGTYGGSLFTVPTDPVFYQPGLATSCARNFWLSYEYDEDGNVTFKAQVYDNDFNLINSWPIVTEPDGFGFSVEGVCISPDGNTGWVYLIDGSSPPYLQWLYSINLNTGVVSVITDFFTTRFTLNMTIPAPVLTCIAQRLAVVNFIGLGV